MYDWYNAKVAELVDAHDSKSCSFGSVGSIPTFGTINGLYGMYSPFIVVNLLSFYYRIGNREFFPLKSSNV